MRARNGEMANLELYFKDIRLADLELEEEEIICEQLKERILSGGEEWEIRTKLVMLYLRLVVSQALKYASRKGPIDDLIQTGNLFCLDKVVDYNPFKGYKFGTYLTKSLIHKLRSTFYENLFPIFTLKKGAIVSIFKIRKAIDGYYQRYGEYPTPEVIAGLVDFSQEQVRKLMCLMRVAVRQKEPDSEYDETARQEEKKFLSYSLTAESRDPYSILEAKDEISHACMEIKELFSRIAAFDLELKQKRISRIFRLRYGLTEKEMPCTNKELTGHFSISEERIRQIIKQTWRRLEKSYASEKLADGKTPTEESPIKDEQWLCSTILRMRALEEIAGVRFVHFLADLEN